MPMQITNLANQPAYTVTKAQQTNSNRIKLTNAQKTELSAKEVKRLEARSNGVCERCDRHRAEEKAHIERRWHSVARPTAEDFAHLCIPCHRWCDGSREGRNWLIAFQKNLLRGIRE